MEEKYSSNDDVIKKYKNNSLQNRTWKKNLVARNKETKIEKKNVFYDNF